MPRRRLIDDLRFAETPVLVEQVRLVLRSVVSSTMQVVFLSFLMLLILANSDNYSILLVWFTVVVVSKFASFLVANHYLNRDIPGSAARPLAWFLIVSYALNGLAWGTLPWLVMDTATTAGRVITLSLMAGVIGSAMAQTSAVLGVFIAFSLTTLGLVGGKLLLLDDPAYTAFAAATALYFFSLLSLARNNAAAALDAITLRFENSKLLEKLQVETELSEKARLEAESANRTKSKFLAAASHDLRQPVHSQGLFLSVLEGTALTAQQRELVESIRHSAEASREMLNTLLNFSRIEAGVVHAMPQTFALQPLLYKLESEMAPLADTRDLVYRSRETDLFVSSDPALLELILRNLISNAIRYTECGGILVGARRRGERCLIEVWDTGIGIEPSQQSEVFREFHQLGNPERDSSKGLGLGLAISAGLARTLEHPLTLDSVPGRGSVFRLDVALAEELPTDALAVKEVTGKQLFNARVLVIDDEQSIRAGMRHLLQEWGCEVQAVEGIEEALRLVQQWRPDLLISDYRLREQRTGGEAIDAVRAALQSELPAILITGDTAPERLREAEAIGVPLLHKPVSTAQLRRSMGELLQTTAI